MPAPPEESEPAIVSAIGIAIGSLAQEMPLLRHVLARRVVASKLCEAIVKPAKAICPWRGSDGSLFRSDQMQARPVLRRCQCACGSRDRLRDLLDRRPLRSARKILCRERRRYR